MILFDEASTHGPASKPATGATVTALAANDRDATADADPGEDRRQEQSAREQVEEWLDAVALCFNLPEGRRWIDYERL